MYRWKIWLAFVATEVLLSGLIETVFVFFLLFSLREGDISIWGIFIIHLIQCSNIILVVCIKTPLNGAKHTNDSFD